MRENTFDIPSVKFCIGYDSNLNDKRICKINEHFIFVPFEDVDGLTIDDVLKTIKKGEFYFYAIALTKDITGKIYDRGDLVIEKFDWSSLQTQKLELIDKVVEKRLEEKYNSASYQEQRIYKCFFERYQDGSYEKTKERIKKLKDGK